MAIEQIQVRLQELEERIHVIRWFEAVKHGHVNDTEELLRSNPLNLIKLDDEEYFDYHLMIQALENHQIHIAKLLIENGFRVYKKSKSVQEKTVLHAAVELSDDTEFITTLLTKGASQDILVLNRQNKTPFHLAIDRNQLSTVKLFLSQFNNVKTLDGQHFLHNAVSQDKIVLVTELIKAGFSIHRKNKRSLTPFCVAWENKKFEILNHLLSFCTEEKIKSNNYNNVAPVYIASMCGYLKLVKKYADFGLSIDRPLMSSNDPWACLINCSGFTLLHFAVEHIKLKVVKFLLSLGADITVKNNDGSTPLHLAFEMKERGVWKTWQHFHDNNLIIDLILKANMRIKSNPVNKYKLSHFHIACSRDEPAVVEHFLKLGAVINRPNQSQSHCYKGFYPLHFAAKFRCKGTLESLLKNRANVKKRDFQKMTALHIAAQESCLDTVRLLLEYGAEITSIDSDGNSPVHLAFKNRNYAVIDLLLSVHNKVHYNSINAEGLSHFHIACTRNDVGVVKSFIENGVAISISIPKHSSKNKNCYRAYWAGYSPLHFAVSYNRSRNVQLLLDSGASVEIKDSLERTPLHLACQYNYELFEEFIETTLYDFSKRGKIALQSRPMTDVNEVFESYSTGFNDCTGKFNWQPNRMEHLKIINLLLKYNSDVNSIDSQDHTPVCYAYAAVADTRYTIEDDLNDCSDTVCKQIVTSLSDELLERRKLILNNLLKMDANLGKCHSNGPILHYICSIDWANQSDVDIMQLFLDNGADVDGCNSSMLTPLHIATLHINANLVRTLLDYGANVDSIHPIHNRTALLMAASNQTYLFHCTNIMKVLIDKGANVNARNSNGKTALHLLARPDDWGSIDTAVLNLIKAGADINSQDLKGRTPLHKACSKITDEAAEVFLKFGADINVEDNEGRSVCCYLYDKYLKNIQINDMSYDLEFLIKLLQNHVMKMKLVGLPISEKERSSCAKFYNFVTRTDEDKKKLMDEYESELQILRDTKINYYYSLYNAIFKKENALAKLVKNRAFKSIVESKSFRKTYPHYGYLVQLKYQAGADRAKLLPTAKSLLYNLVGLHLPDTCSENIFSYFINFELNESIQVVSKLLNLNSNGLDTMQLRRRRTKKRQKVY